MSHDYLTLADILGIHQELVRCYGGSHGVRDIGAVESALFRPQCGYYEDIFEEAAALLESLLINHPFIDGNKRTAWASCDVFLRINGVVLQVESLEMYRYIIGWIEMIPAKRLAAMTSNLRQLAS